MSLAKKLYYTGCSIIPTPLLKTLSPSTTFFPYHHTVSDEPLAHIRHLYPYKNTKQFINDLEYLLKNFKPIEPGELSEFIEKNDSLPPGRFLLTFDDGFKEVHDIIAPILEAKGVPAVFFINPAFIDNKKLFYRSKTSLLIEELLNRKNDKHVTGHFANALKLNDSNVENIIHTFKSIKTFTDKDVDKLAEKIGLSFNDYLSAKQPFLTMEQLHSLDKRGFTIGGHSWDHPYYPSLSIDEQVEQTLSSCRFVKEHFASTPLCFSFPYSDSELKQELFDRLLQSEIDLFFGIQNQKDELRNRMVHRFNAERPQYDLRSQMKGLMIYRMINKSDTITRK